MRIIAFIFIVFLSGCSQQAKNIEPTQDDIVTAIKNEIDTQNKKVSEMSQNNEQMANLAKVTGGLTTEFISAQKLGCEKASNLSGFNCDVAIEIVAPMVGKQKTNTTIRFVKKENDWMIVSQ